MTPIDKSASIAVTGGTGYVAGWIIKYLLDDGLTVHATVRDPDRADRVGHLRKLAERPSPPFARLRGYIMPPIPAGYTVRSDVLGIPKRNRFLPDMGLINSGYLLILTGTSERNRLLRVVSWSPVPRIVQEIPFPWEGNTWYSTKLSVDIREGRGLVRAKVWPRTEAEPSAWTVTMDDPCPNLGGSPGLYAYAVGITSKSKGTEVLFDNVAITPNGDR